MEMKARFSDTQMKAVLGLSLVPAAVDKDWKSKTQELAEFIMMIFLVLITFLWNFTTGSLNGMGTREKNQVIRNKHCHMWIVLYFKILGSF